LAPSASQRTHWKEYDVGEPVHFPVDAVRTAPSLAVPEIAGADVFDGAAETVVVSFAVVATVVVALVAAELSATEAAKPAPAMHTATRLLPRFTFPSLVRFGGKTGVTNIAFRSLPIFYQRARFRQIWASIEAWRP
jgi:hypothetical protein